MARFMVAVAVYPPYFYGREPYMDNVHPVTV